MKNFLKYVGVFSASLILLIIGVEYMLRQVPNALAFKKELIEKHTQDWQLCSQLWNQSSLSS